VHDGHRDERVPEERTRSRSVSSLTVAGDFPGFRASFEPRPRRAAILIARAPTRGE